MALFFLVVVMMVVMTAVMVVLMAGTVVVMMVLTVLFVVPVALTFVVCMMKFFHIWCVFLMQRYWKVSATGLQMSRGPRCRMSDADEPQPATVRAITCDCGATTEVSGQ